MATHTSDQSGRTFRTTMAATIALLLVLCIGLSALSFFQGPKLTETQVDTSAVTTSPDQQLRMFANQAVAEVRPGQVSVEPAAEFTVSTSESTIAVQFEQPLNYDTDYTVEIDGVTSAYRYQPSTFRYRFSTPAADLHYLDRADPAEDSGRQDAIMSAPLGGVGSNVVYEAPAIQDFVVSGDILAVATLNEDETSSLTLVDVRDGTREQVLLPDTGTIGLLRANAAGIVGFTFTSADGPIPELFDVLHTLDLNGSHSPQPVVGLNGEPMSALNWYPIGDTATAFVHTRDQSMVVVDLTGEAVAIPRGQFNELVSISPDSTRVVVADALGLNVIDIADGSSQPMAPSLIDGIRPFAGQTVMLGGERVNVSQVAVFDEASGGFASYVVHDDGTSSRVLYQNPGNKGSIGEFRVSPNGQYVAIEATPAGSTLDIDGYVLNPQPKAVMTIIVDISSGSIVRTLNGFAPVW